MIVVSLIRIALLSMVLTLRTVLVLRTVLIRIGTAAVIVGTGLGRMISHSPVLRVGIMIL